MNRVQLLWNEPQIGRNVCVSLVCGLMIAASGSVPYYFPDSVSGGRLELFFGVPGGLFMVGLLLASLLSASEHDVSLVAAIIVNWTIYGAGMFMILRRLTRRTRRRDGS